jgi:hypothetical protein
MEVVAQLEAIIQEFNARSDFDKWCDDFFGDE